MKQCWPAPERNKQAILDVLRRVLPSSGRVLEIGSGTGQHAAFFAASLPALSWQPSDFDPEHLASLQAWTAEAGPNLLPPLTIDTRDPRWPVDAVQAVFSANMIHIAPWECCVGLIEGAARHLQAQGVLVLYGPFRLDGAHTAQSNADFDRSLRERDPRWGVRDAEAVIELAERAGLSFRERVPMPANNQILVFQKR